MATLPSLRSGPDANARLALDANALSALKQQAKTAPGDALSKAAGQFEALFVQQLLKQMRESLPQDGPLGSDSTKTYTAMYDQQIAQQISNRGIGLRAMIEKQLALRMQDGAAPGNAPAGALGGALGGTPAAASPGTPAAASPGTPAAAPARLTVRSTAAPAAPADTVQPPGRAEGVEAPRRSPVVSASPPTRAASESAARPSRTGTLPSAVQSFIDKLRPHAEAAAKALGLPAEYLIAQAGLETGWGRSLPKTASGATSYNLFGMKAGAGWTGTVAQAKTAEYDNGTRVESSARFRSYASIGDSLQDFARLLRTSSRYSGVLAHATDAKSYAASLQRAGYATDPQYAAKLARTIETVARATAASRTSVAEASAPGKVGTIKVSATAVDNRIVAG